MLSVNGIGINKNPLLETPFVQNFEIGANYPPPGTSLMVTENGQLMITEDGNNMATENNND